MEQKFSNLLGRFSNLNAKLTSVQNDSNEPQIGFKVTYSDSEKQLKVKVIGARKLPAIYGNVRPKGYLAKITVFPEKDKFETKTVKDVNPMINEEFVFSLQNSSKYGGDSVKGKFVSFTVYANLEDEQDTMGTKPKHVLQRFFSFDESNKDLVELRRKPNRSSIRKSYRNSLNNRRTVGTVQYNLDLKNFTQKGSGKEICTPDIWRPIQDISSGMVGQSRDGTKGSAEVTLSYAVSEDGNNDVVEVSVTKFRCSVQTMQHHEKVGGQLYIKITAFEREDLVQKMKSDKFEPTIALKLDASTSTLRANVSQYNINEVKLLIRLISRNMLGKKELLGKIEINRHSDIWKEIVATPSIPVTKMMHFQ